ncbi:MAG: hypothetical protein ACPGQL_09865 [Thermoplasmatota archaeon]
MFIEMIVAIALATSLILLTLLVAGKTDPEGAPAKMQVGALATLLVATVLGLTTLVLGP